MCSGQPEYCYNPHCFRPPKLASFQVISMNRRFLTSPLRGLTKPTNSRDKRSVKLDMEVLEPLNMLAPLYPDMFAWEDAGRGYLHDYIVEGDLLRFTTALANDGAGHLEVYGGQPLPNGNQEVFQRIYHDDGTFEDHLAGEFTYHPGHGHIHFDGYAIYNLREITSDGGVGDVLATGGKVSFCLIDIAQYNPNAGSSNYHSCGQTQGVSAGWSDVYGRGLSNQWIDITGIADGQYWLEVIVDPEDQLLESDETNNTTRIIVDINGGPGNQGDRYEPNNNFANASNLGAVAQRQEAGISIHSETDEDYYQFTTVEDGNFEVTVQFTHALGNLDAFIYDSNQNLIASGTTTTDVEVLAFPVLANETYYLHIDGVNGETNGYELDFDGPGDIVTVTIPSTAVPVAIPDGVGSSQPGAAAISTIEGADITLTDLNLIFDDLQHTWLGDLDFKLTSPAGTQATIIASQWNGGGLLGSEDDFFGTFLDDQAPTNLDDGNAPFTGSFNVQHASVPLNPLSVFNGESALGTWTLEIVDWHSADTGTLRAWSLMFSGIDNNPGDTLEQNDAFPQATWLGQLGSVNHENLSIHTAEDEDFFRFQAAATGMAQIDLTFSQTNGNLDFYVYDDSLTEIGRSDSTTDNESLALAVQNGDIYYIQVVGFNGATNANYGLAVDASTQPFETGDVVLVDHQWQSVAFQREFVDPVVILSLPTFVGGDPVTTRIQNVTSTGFEMQLMEWNYLDGTHALESIGYFVIEAGRHVMDDGTVIEAGFVEDVAQPFAKGAYTVPFTTTPMVMAQVEASHGDALVPRMIDSASHAFGIRVQEQESANSAYPGPSAKLHFVSLVPGTGDLNGKAYEVGALENMNSGTVSFQNPFATTPLVFGMLQTVKDLDPVNVRLLGSTGDDFSFQFQEETSFDPETNHGGEQFGFLALATSSFARTSGPAVDDANLETRPIAADRIEDSAAQDLRRSGRWKIDTVSTVKYPGDQNAPRLLPAETQRDSAFTLLSSSFMVERTPEEQIALPADRRLGINDVAGEPLVIQAPLATLDSAIRQEFDFR